MRYGWRSDTHRRPDPGPARSHRRRHPRLLRPRAGVDRHGHGIPAAINIAVTGADLRFSHQTESCDGDKSNTDGGLFDIDGDGRPEVIGLVGNTFVVSAACRRAGVRHTGGRSPDGTRQRLRRQDEHHLCVCETFHRQPSAVSRDSRQLSRDDRHPESWRYARRVSLRIQQRRAGLRLGA